MSSPLLFLLYINDVDAACGNLKRIHFADDTTLFMSGSNIKDLCQNVTNNLIGIDNWLTNRLSLNVNKTNFMLFTHRLIAMQCKP